MAYPGRVTDLEHEFGISYSTISRLFNAVLYWIDENHSFRINNYMRFWRVYQMMLNLAVRRKGLPEGYGTINSLLTVLCVHAVSLQMAPGDHMMFSGSYIQVINRGHYIKFQSLFYPNGMIGDLYGSMIGRRHDSYLLRKSGLNNRILSMLHPFLPDTVYHTYGDAAYPHLPLWLKRGGRRN